jgi:hypothetical protein
VGCGGRRNQALARGRGKRRRMSRLKENGVDIARRYNYISTRLLITRLCMRGGCLLGRETKQ